MRFLLIMSMVFLSTSSILAQVKLGVKGGVNIVNVYDGPVSPDINNQYRVAYHGGVYGQYEIDNRFAIRTELLYSKKGCRSVNPTGKANVNLHYLNLPVLAEYRIQEQFSVLLGPELGYLLSAKSRFDNQRVNIGWLWDRKIDLGMATGFRYQVNKDVDLGLRYTHGLLNVMSSKIVLTNERGEPVGEMNYKSQNRTFQFSVAIG